MTRIGFYILIVVAMSCTTTVAQSLSIEELVSRAVAKLNDADHDRALDYIRTQSRRVSTLDELEFRTETDEWNLNRQEYTFRSSFKSRDRVNAEKRLLGSWTDVLVYEKKEQQEEQLLLLYRQMIEIHSSYAMLEVMESELTLATDRLAVEQVQAKNGQKVRPATLLELRSDIYELRSKKSLLAEQIADAEIRVLGDMSTPANIDFSNWATPADVHAKVLLLLEDTNASTKLQGRQHDVNRKELELAKERAEGQQSLDFMQLKYTGDDRAGIGNNFSFGLAVQLPTGTRNRTGIAEAAIELYREQQQYERAIAQQLEDEKDATAQYMATYKEWLAADKKRNDMAMEEVLAALVVLEGTTVDDILSVKELILKESKMINQRERSLYRDYLDLLLETGMLGTDKAARAFTKN